MQFLGWLFGWSRYFASHETSSGCFKRREGQWVGRCLLRARFRPSLGMDIKAARLSFSEDGGFLANQ